MRNGQNNNKNRMRNNRNSHGGGHNNNNNRRNQNPMTRVFESNGPDIKIRGTASHIAEKYVQLARDARTSGDPVAAENYYQHAEHYFRLIAAAQEQFRQSQPQPRDGEMVPTGSTMGDETGEDDADNFSHFGAEPGFVPMQQQPFVQPPPRENTYQPREQHQPREHRPQPAYQPQPTVQPSDAGIGGLPSFITGGQPAAAAAPFEGNATPQERGERERFPRRRRRPHGPRPEGAPAPVPASDDA